MGMEEEGAWDEFKKSWTDQTDAKTATTIGEEKQEVVWSMWSSPFLNDISHKPSVDHVLALGSVLAIALKDEAGGGKFFHPSLLLSPLLWMLKY